MWQRIIGILENNRKELFNNWVDELRSKKTIQEDLPEAKDTRGLFDLIYQSITSMDTDTTSDLRIFYSRLLTFNGSLNFITYGFQAFRRIALKTLIQEDLSKSEILKVYNEIDRWFDPVLSQIVNDCTENWESMFAQQKDQINELSAPVIQLFKNIVVMPLVGTISEDRAKTIMENLLQGITNYKSQIVFLDISGVPVVDTFVAQALIDSTRAARLLGAECIMVGMRPEIAQTIINLGIDLKEIKTFGSLSHGLTYALNKSD